MKYETNISIHLQNDASADGFAKKSLEMGLFTLPTNFCKITATTNELIDSNFPKSTTKITEIFSDSVHELSW